MKIKTVTGNCFVSDCFGKRAL